VDVENSKFKAPNSKQAPMSEAQMSNAKSFEFGNWGLEFVWDSEIGIWNFG
jgi:hypothetical protein